MAEGTPLGSPMDDAPLLDAGLSPVDLVELRTEYFLPDKSMHNYITAFRKYDEDGSGDIDVSELGKLLHDLGIKLPEADIDDMMTIVDTDGGGSVGISEFVYLMADPDGPLAKTIFTQEGVIDPRQARLKRNFKEVQRKRRELFASRMVRLQARLRCRDPGRPSDSDVGRRGWAGGAGIAAVACSEVCARPQPPADLSTPTLPRPAPMRSSIGVCCQQIDLSVEQEPADKRVIRFNSR